MKVRKLLIVTFVATLAALIAIGTAVTAMTSTVVVTPTNLQGWSTEDTRTGGAVNFVVDSSAPSGVGALQLTTDATTAAKAQFLHAAETPLAGVTELSYYTKQNSGPAIAAPSYQVIAFLNGGSGFTTLVFEPYQNLQLGPIIPNIWQSWDVDSGFFWSTRTVTCSNGTILGTPGGPANYTLAQINAACPNAVVIGYGVNIGTNNPLYDVETDLFNFNGTTYDFEPYLVARNKDQCKNGGFNDVKRADGSSFKNQGDCVSYTVNGK